MNGYDLCLSLDYNIQMYCEQAAKKVCTKKSADSVSVIVMNPQNGELMAMVNYPEFDLNNPFTLAGDTGEAVSAEEKQNLLNKMWRNQCISDTYEPGSTFKIITAAAALEEGVVKLDDAFFCPGYKIVDRDHELLQPGFYGTWRAVRRGELCRLLQTVRAVIQNEY